MSVSSTAADQQVLLQRVQRVARRAVWLRWWYATVSFLMVVLPVATLLGVADFLLRFQDRGVRVISSGLLAAWASWAAVHYLWPPARGRSSWLQVAQAIERCFPQLTDRLSSAVAFLQQREDDPRGGSPELRREVIRDAARRIAELDVMQCLDSSAARRATWAVAAMVAALSLLIALQPEAAALAARRLAAPWDDSRWPRWNELAFDELPRRVASGSDFEAEVVDRRGRLPQDVQLLVWFEEDPAAAIEQRPMKRAGRRMVAQLSNVTRPFRVRAVGGDDDRMAWHTVEVVEPPKIVQMQVQVTPPGYTGLPPAESGRQVRAWEGSRVDVRVELNKPVAEVDLAASFASEAPLQVRLVDDGRAFHVVNAQGEPFVAQESGTIVFTLTDAKGITSEDSERCELQVIPDQPPTVSVESPGHGAFYAPQAVIPVRALLKDDLGVARAELHFGEQYIEMEETAEASAEGLPGQAAGASSLRSYQWDLASLQLAPGSSLEFEVLAWDHKPQQGSSGRIRITVVSADELARRFDQRRFQILQQLREAVRAQRSARDQLKYLEIQWDETGKLAQDEIDYLQAAEVNQRHVRQLVEAPPAGVVPRIADLLQDVASNRVRRSAASEGMTELREALESLSSELLQPLESRLSEAVKAAQQASESDAGSELLEGRFAAAGETQEAVLARLEALLASLERWDDFHRFARDLGDLIEQQRQIGRTIDELPTWGRDVRRLEPAQRADLRQLAQQQRAAARDFERLESQMDQAAREMQQAQGRAGLAASEAVEIARQHAVAGKLRQIAQGLEQNLLGEAAAQRTEVEAALNDMMAALTGTTDLSEGRAAGELRQAAQELEQLGKRQQQQAAAARDASSASPELIENQQALARDAARMQSQLDRLRAEAGRRALAAATEHMQQSAGALQQGQQDRAAQQAGEAAEAIAEAARQLEQQLGELQQQLAQRREEQLLQHVQELAERQQIAREATEAWRAQTAADDSSVSAPKQLWEQQQALAAETQRVGSQLTSQQVVEFALRMTAATMQQAADALQQNATAQAAAAAVQQQDRAMRQLESILRSLEPANRDGGSPDDRASGGTPPSPQQPQQEQGADVEQLRLLRELQQDINQRTAALRQDDADRGSPAWTQEVEQLAEQQQTLAELLSRLQTNTDQSEMP